MCGRDYESKGAQKYCSPECKRAGYKRVENLREKKKRKPKRESQIDRLNTEARALGLSYGQYKAMQYKEAMHL